MDLRYKCAVVDHDDTAVDSTRLIHYPIYRELLGEMRPDYEIMSLDGFINMNRNQGIKRHYVEDLNFTEDEWKYAFELWLNHPLRKTIPSFYEGFIEIFEKFSSANGIFAVVSHSDENAIRMHYSNKGNLMPKFIVGANGNPDYNKPNSWPLDKIMEMYDVGSRDIIVVDDLEPGINMAEKRNVDTFGVGWSHENPDSFKERCTFYSDNIEDLEGVLF
ncbi:MAG: HAD family hydrolase [Nanoarchaeota archaeon]